MTPHWASGAAGLPPCTHPWEMSCYTSECCYLHGAKAWQTCSHEVKRSCWNWVQNNKRNWVQNIFLLQLQKEGSQILFWSSCSGWLECWTWSSGSSGQHKDTVFQQTLDGQKEDQKSEFYRHWAFLHCVCPITWSCSVAWEMSDFHVFISVEVRSSRDIWYLHQHVQNAWSSHTIPPRE